MQASFHRSGTLGRYDKIIVHQQGRFLGQRQQRLVETGPSRLGHVPRLLGSFGRALDICSRRNHHDFAGVAGKSPGTPYGATRDLGRAIGEDYDVQLNSLVSAWS
jgi:hypothetical protein